MVTYLQFLVNPRIVYEFNCILMILLKKEINNTQIALEIYEILGMHNLCPHIILKIVSTIKSTRHKCFFHFTSTCCMKVTP
jgi:hypothetical protein